MPLIPKTDGGSIHWTLLREKIIEILIYISGFSAIIFVFSIFAFIFKEASGFVFSHETDWSFFFFNAAWQPLPEESATYGAFSMIIGTISVTLVAMLIAVPFGLGLAVLVSEFCSPKIKETLKIVIELLAAIPSVVWGFVGLKLMNYVLVNFFGAQVGSNLFNGGIVLALMSLPIIVSIAEDAFKAVPDSYREAAEALGATKWQVVYKVLFPAAKNGLLAAVLLGVGRAVGETMAVLMCTGHNLNNPFSSEFPFLNIFDPIRTLTASIAAELGEAPRGSEHWQALFALGLLLFAIIFVINLTADLVVRGIKQEES